MLYDYVGNGNLSTWPGDALEGANRREKGKFHYLMIGVLYIEHIYAL